MTKSHLALVAPATVNGTVAHRPPRRRPNAEVRAREYLTDAEVNRLIAAAGSNRHGHRDATMVLVAYRHGLRAAELVALRWDSVDFGHGRLHVNRAKSGSPASIPCRAASCGRCAGSGASKSLKSRSFSPRSGARRSPPRASASWSPGLALRPSFELPGPSAHAAARLRLPAGQQGRRYPQPAGLPRAQEHPAHRALHRAVADPVQGLLARLGP